MDKATPPPAAQGADSDAAARPRGGRRPARERRIWILLAAGCAATLASSVAGRLSPGWFADLALGAAVLLLALAAVAATRIEAAFRESREAALEASRAKSRFLATVSHEMRTPLTAILGMLDLALRGEPEGERRRYLRTARLSGDQLLQLINGLLDMAKIESGTLALNSRPFSLTGLVEGCVESLAPRAREKGLDLTFEVTAGMADGVRGDVTRVRQVLLNLLDNAVKFTDEGEVSVLARPVAGSAGRVAFEVRDSGPGVAPRDRERIFEPFLQADSSDSRRHGGTGLGLAICRDLVERMRGRLWLESEAGRGSTFHFEIELQPDPAGAALSPEQTAKLRGLRLLVVHRSVEIQERICGTLRRHGLEPTLVEEPFLVPAILRAAEKAGRPFRLILLDRHVRGASALQGRRPADDPLVSRLTRILISDEEFGLSSVPGGIPTVPRSPTENDLLRAIHDALQEDVPEPAGFSAADAREEPAERR
ncbi:MAG TPA: ATP-binding protein, partial [Thermoanaerobaculia bacterium]|nr:ATP-binding protein [Thermoanaerobaculia bacterium]